MYRHNHNYINFNLIMLCACLVCLSVFYSSNNFTNYMNPNSREGIMNGSSMGYKALHYIWLQSAESWFSEEKTRTESKFESLNDFLSYSKCYLYNALNMLLPSLNRLILYLLLLLFPMKSRLNTTTANSIPLGGHAPPFLFYGFA